MTRGIGTHGILHGLGVIITLGIGTLGGPLGHGHGAHGIHIGHGAGILITHGHGVGARLGIGDPAGDRFMHGTLQHHQVLLVLTDPSEVQ